MDPQPPSNIQERARSNFNKILNEHQPEPLPEALQVELKNIIKAAERQDAE